MDAREKLLVMLLAGVPAAECAMRLKLSRARVYQLREKLIESGAMAAGEDGPVRDAALPRVRVSRAERRRAERTAKAEGLTLVEFIRKRVTAS